MALWRPWLNYSLQVSKLIKVNTIEKLSFYSQLSWGNHADINNKVDVTYSENRSAPPWLGNKLKQRWTHTLSPLWALPLVGFGRVSGGSNPHTFNALALFLWPVHRGRKSNEHSATSDLKHIVIFMLYIWTCKWYVQLYVSAVMLIETCYLLNFNQNHYLYKL